MLYFLFASNAEVRFYSSMVFDHKISTDSSHQSGRSLASPPYEGRQAGSSMPPHYQSQIDLTRQPSHSSDEKGKQKTLPDSGADFDVDDVPQPRIKMTTQGPRIAVINPLTDIRSRNISHPEGLGEKSDYSPRFKFDPPSEGSPTLSRRNSDASSVDDQGDFFDEFDWSEDEEEREAAVKEEKQALAVSIRRKRYSPFSIIKWLATTFLGNLLVSIALVVPAIVIQFIYRDKTANDANASHRKYVADNVQAWTIWMSINLHLEWWIHLLVELFPRVAMAIHRGVWGGISQKELSSVEYYNVIKGYLKPIYYAALSWGSWAIIFNSIYGLYTRTNPETESRAKYLYRVYQVIEFLFFFILTICVEKILVKIISVRFHQTAFSDRIAKVTKSLKVFDYLQDHRPKAADKGFHSPFGLRVGGRTPGGSRTPVSKRSPSYESEGLNEKEEVKRGYFGRKKHAHMRPVDQASLPASAQDGLHTPGGISRSANAARVMRQKATHATALARVAMVDPTHLLTDKTVGVGLDVNSPAEARRLARSIFRAYRRQHHRAYLIPSDFNSAYSNPVEAKEAFEVFDEDRNGDISARELKQTIVEAYKERRFISKSLEDTSHALSQLDSIFLAVAFIILIFEAFAIFKVSIGNSLTTIYTLAIGASFIFKESAQNIFDSIIFIFVTHPFDTGDRIVVDGAVMVVQKMSLLSSQFLLWDNTQIFISNSMLSQMFITNYRRSGYQWESVSIDVAFDTPLERLDAVQADMIHWLQTEPDRMFEPSTAIVPQSIDYMRSITLTLGMTHRGNWQDWGARWFRRNAFFSAVCYYMRKHGVRYMNSNQPILYSDPPPYENAEPTTFEEQEAQASTSVPPAEDPLLAGVNDDFTPPKTAGGLMASGMSATIKPKTLMNFTPPPDEVMGSQLRIRKARQYKKGMAQQGGDS